MAGTECAAQGLQVGRYLQGVKRWRRFLGVEVLRKSKEQSAGWALGLELLGNARAKRSSYLQARTSHSR